MQSTDRVDFVRVLNGLAAIKRVELTKEAIDLWWAALSPRWELADFKGAASHLVTSCQFMPTPYDFEQLRKAGELTPSEAWTEALAACTNWRNPKLLPNGRVSRAAAAVGGFRAIAMCDTERDLPHVQRRFLEAYEELTDVESVRAALPDFTAKQLTRKTNGFAQIGHEVDLEDR